MSLPDINLAARIGKRRLTYDMVKITRTLPLSSAFVTAMMNDASDGVMNGRMGSSQITMPMSGGMGGGMNGMGNMASTAGTSGLSSAMSTFMGSPANASGLTAVDMVVLLNKLSTSNGQI